MVWCAWRLGTFGGGLVRVAGLGGRCCMWKFVGFAGKACWIVRVVGPWSVWGRRLVEVGLLWIRGSLRRGLS